MRLAAARIAGLLSLLAAPAWADEPPNGAIDDLRCTPALEGYHIEVLASGVRAPAVVEVIDTEGRHHRKLLQAPGRSLSFTLPARAVSACLDPDGALPDPDRYDNHFPRRITITPWPEAPRDSYLVRYFPGLTFKQGPAPVRPRGAPMLPPVQGPMGLGLGLEGRRPGEHGWQVLANFGASPFQPSLLPRFSLHGYYLPHPNWGLDADVGVDLAGTLTTELGTSLITWDGTGPQADSPVLAHQWRAAFGQQAPHLPAQAPFRYGQLSMFRDDAAWLGFSSNATILAGLDGAWRADLATQHSRMLGDGLAWRLGATAGTSGNGLAAPNRLGAGLFSHDWLTAGSRLSCRATLLAPLAQGLAVPLGLGTLAQVEGGLFVEAARLWRVDGPIAEGALAGIGAELTVVQDTLLGMPLAINVGYAVPAWGLGGPQAPWPGRFYVMTTDAFFPRRAAD